MTTDVSLDVSRETMDRLSHFVGMVEKWNNRINLVSKSSLPDIWERHITDSLQIHALGAQRPPWVDMGSGGGFPGIVIATLEKETEAPDATVLVESDQRKAVFLRAAIRELELNAKVISERIEKVNPLRAGTLSARALADLPTLMTYAERHLEASGTALFPKGESWQSEVERARTMWHFNLEAIPSVTEPQAAILKIKDITRV